MFESIAIISTFLWLVALLFSVTLDGFVHLLLLIAVIATVMHIVSHESA